MAEDAPVEISDDGTTQYYHIKAKDYDSFKEQYYRMKDFVAIDGIKTSNGIVISGISKHQYERMIERNVSINEIKNALTSPIHICDIIINEDSGKRSQRFIGQKATVNINPDTGNIITVWKTGEKTRNKYTEG